MDTSMNMISALSAGSGFGALTSDSIPSLFSDGTLDFQSLLLGMMKDTESPVSEAFESNGLLNTDLMTGFFPGAGSSRSSTEGPSDLEDLNSMFGLKNPNSMVPDKDKGKFSLAAELMEVSVKMQELNVSQIQQQAADIRAAQTNRVTETVNQVAQKTSEPMMTVPKEPQQMQQTDFEEVLKTMPQTAAETEVQPVQAEAKAAANEAAAKQAVQVTTENAAEPTARPVVIQPEQAAKQHEEVIETEGISKVVRTEDLGTKQQMPPEKIQQPQAEHITENVVSKADGSNEPETVFDERLVPKDTQTTAVESETVDVSAKHQTNANEAETREQAEPMLQPLTNDVKVETPVQIRNAEPAHKAPAAVYVQVAEQVEMAAAEGKDELTMQLDPEGLGEISVRLAKTGNKLSISITAANPETHNLLLSHSHDLVKALNLSHVSVEGIQIQTQANETQDTPVTATNGYDFNQSVDVNREGQQREHQETHHFSRQTPGERAQEQDSQKEMNETVEMLRAQMSRLNYLA